MKSVILLALVAFAAAGPVQQRIAPRLVEKNMQFNEIQYPGQFIPQEYEYGMYQQQWGQGKTYQVAQFLAYQFYKVQQLGHTSRQVFEFFLEHEFPQYVAEYLAQQYEASLSFKTPYLLFQYFYQQHIPEEIVQYILSHTGSAYSQFQAYYNQYGQPAFEREYTGVPLPFSQYIVHLGKYYTQNGVTFSKAHLAYQQLQLAQHFVENALHYIAQGQVPQQYYQYVYTQLEQGLHYILKAELVYQQYQGYQQYYIPYYVAQHYIELTQQAYQYFLNVYQYIQQQQYSWPQYFVQQVQYAYLAAQKAYEIYQPSQYSQVNFEGLYPSYKQVYGKGYSPSYYQAVFYYKQLLQYIETVQKYIESQPTMPKAEYVAQQLRLAYQSYQYAFQFWQQRYTASSMVEYPYQHIEQGYKYLNLAFVAAQQLEHPYLIQELQMALQYAQRLHFVGQYFQYQYGHQEFQYGQQYGFTHETILRPAYQYAQYIFEFIQQQVRQGVIPQEYATYIYQQLEFVQKAQSIEQMMEYYKNIFYYIQQKVNIPQYFVQYLLQQVQYALHILQGVHQQWQYQYGQTYPSGQGYFYGMIQKYFNKEQYPTSYIKQYQYGPYSQEYGYYPYGTRYQRDINTPYFNYGYQYGSYEPRTYQTYKFPFQQQYGSEYPYNYYGNYRQTAIAA